MVKGPAGRKREGAPGHAAGTPLPYCPLSRSREREAAAILRVQAVSLWIDELAAQCNVSSCVTHSHLQECRSLERQAARAQASLVAERHESTAAKASCAKVQWAS